MASIATSIAAATATCTLSQEQQELNALAKEVAVKLLTPEAITRAEFNEILTSSLAKLEELTMANAEVLQQDDTTTTTTAVPVLGWCKETQQYVHFTPTGRAFWQKHACLTPEQANVLFGGEYPDGSKAYEAMALSNEQLNGVLEGMCERFKCLGNPDKDDKIRREEAESMLVDVAGSKKRGFGRAFFTSAMTNEDLKEKAMEVAKYCEGWGIK